MDAQTLLAETSTLGSGATIDRAMKQAVRERLLEHKRLGQSIAVWRDNKVVILTADEINLPPWPEPDDETGDATSSADAAQSTHR